MEMSVIRLANQVQTEGDAYVYLERLRWGDTPVCAHCDSTNVVYLAPANGINRKTRTGSASERRVWKCRDCRKQFSVLTGTIFHGTKIPVRIWLFVIYEMCSCKNGVAAREIERRYDLTAKTAWFMLHRIREAMKREPLVGMLKGTIVADETFIGGKPKNKHRQGVRRRPVGEHARDHVTPKTAVLSLVNKETGEVRSRVIPDVTGPTLAKALGDHVAIGESTLHTDGWTGYRQVGQEFVNHEWVDHHSHEYVRGDVSTNMAEGYFSQLKRSIDGTHHHVSTTHLDRYLAEFDFRYSNRKETDSQRTERLAGQVGGKRLTWKPLGGA